MLAIHNYVIYGRPLKNGQMANQGFSPKEPHSLHIAWRQPCSRREWETLGASENGGFNIWMRNMGCLWNWIVEHLRFVITCLASTSSFVISEVATFSRSYVTSEQVLNNEYAKYTFQNCQCWYFLPVSSVNKQGAKKYQEQGGQHLLLSCHYLKSFKPSAEVTFVNVVKEERKLLM